jgi:hypothetical protein
MSKPDVSAGNIGDPANGLEQAVLPQSGVISIELQLPTELTGND